MVFCATLFPFSNAFLMLYFILSPSGWRSLKCFAKLLNVLTGHHTQFVGESWELN